MGRSVCSRLAVLAHVTLTLTLGNDNTLATDGGLTLVALHQMLSVVVTLFTDGTAAVFFPATIANDAGAAILTETSGRKKKSPQRMAGMGE